MNQNFLDTVYLFSCGVRGTTPESTHDFNFKEIYRIAKSQGVWETVFLSVMKLYEKDPEIIPEKTYQKLNSDFLICCGAQYRRLSFIHEVIKKLEENGIECCVLKGESIARFYHTPIARVSSDADILINPQKTDLCLEIMKEIGFDVGNNIYESHQVECTHPVAGLVEIHTMMYGKRTEDVCFNNEVKYNEKYITIKTEDGTELKTLGITDNFLFLMLHFTKHFLSFGVGIRQLSDVLVYVENNYTAIDWIRANQSLENLGFKKFFDCILAIGKEYLAFPDNIFPTSDINEALVEKIFNDMQLGGVFGHDDNTRCGFYELYLNERYKRFNNDSYNDYRNKRKLHRLFPNRKFMAVNFPYVKKSPLLLPIAWIHRIAKGILPKKQNAVPQPNLNHEERLKLMRDLDMI